MGNDEVCSQHQDLMIRMATGDARFEEIQKSLSETLKCVKEVKEEQDKFNRRLFVDNGKDCFQTRLIKLEDNTKVVAESFKRINRTLWWVLTILGGLAVRVVWVLITGHFD